MTAGGKEERRDLRRDRLVRASPRHLRPRRAGGGAGHGSGARGHRRRCEAPRGPRDADRRARRGGAGHRDGSRAAGRCLGRRRLSGLRHQPAVGGSLSGPALDVWSEIRPGGCEGARRPRSDRSSEPPTGGRRHRSRRGRQAARPDPSELRVGAPALREPSALGPARVLSGGARGLRDRPRFGRCGRGPVDRTDARARPAAVALEDRRGAPPSGPPETSKPGRSRSRPRCDRSSSEPPRAWSAPTGSSRPRSPGSSPD